MPLRLLAQCLSFLCFAALAVALPSPAHSHYVSNARSAKLSVSARGTYWKVPNLFSAARNQQLSSAAIDGYIDPRVAGTDRALALSLMQMMPSNLRGDFIYLEPNGHLLTNNLALLPYARITMGGVTTASTIPQRLMNRSSLAASGVYAGRPFARTARPLDYSSSCSPPNPPSMPMGAYARIVSVCGFTAGWAFINVPSGESRMEPGDAGTLYFEITGSAGGLFEGGLQYNSDVSIQPYMRTPAAGGNGYVTLNNSAVHYTADEIIGLFNGLTPDTCNGQPGGPGPTLGYMIAGQLDSSQNPESDWIDSTIVDLDSPAWLFFCSTPDMIGGGADAAGWVSPCLACSVSEVTSIAQGNGVKTYSLDGSYFGVDSLGDDEIQWLQVAFGNWDPSCEPGASECLFDVAANPFVYYGGPQYYPTEDISQENFAPTGYGPYESYSGIDLESSTNFNHILRKTAGKFQEPFPPLPCTADANGNCALLTQNVATGECNTGAKNLHGAPIYVTAYRTTFAIYHSGSPADFLESAVESETIPASAPCTASYSWSPGNPAVQYGDSNLP